MTPAALLELVQDIVQRSLQLVRLRGIAADVRTNYACIFAQSDDERAAMLAAAAQIGRVIVETPSGPIFVFNEPLATAAGNLRLLKIRRPDAARPERGDADFTIADYAALKAREAGDAAFTTVTRPECEMLELVDKGLNIRAYFSDKPLDEELGLI